MAVRRGQEASARTADLEAERDSAAEDLVASVPVATEEERVTGAATASNEEELAAQIDRFPGAEAGDVDVSAVVGSASDVTAEEAVAAGQDAEPEMVATNGTLSPNMKTALVENGAQSPMTYSTGDKAYPGGHWIDDTGAKYSVMTGEPIVYAAETAD